MSVDASDLITVKLNGSTIYSVTDAAKRDGHLWLGGNAVAGDRWENFSLTSP